MRRPIIAGNWKMNKTAAEAVELVEGLKPLVADVTDVEIVVAPTFLSLVPVAEALKGSNIALAAQNMYWEESGAFTGEIAPPMLLDVGCEYVILGHSERRQYFGETNETVNQKAKAAHMIGLKPIVCVGEQLDQREAGTTHDVIRDQVLNGLDGLTAEEMLKTVVAYEPVWAIGTGKTATPDQAQDVHAFIRSQLKEMFSADVADAVRIQYGGSMKPENVAELMAHPDVDGGLIGGASLKADSFAQVVKY